MKKYPVLLGLILLGHLLLGLGFNLVTPIFEPSDEYNHFLFVRYLQVKHALPVQDANPDGPRAHHPPLYHLVGALFSSWIADPGPLAGNTLAVNPHVSFRYGDPNIDNKAMWVHFTPDERWPYHGQALAVRVVRLASLLFSLLAVLFTYLAARQLWPGEERFAVLAAGALAFNGMLLFMSGAVQNSTSAIAATAALLYALARLARRGFRPAEWLWVGLALALGTLLQVSALTLAPVIGLLALFAAWRARSWRPLAHSALGVLLPMAALTGWWFARNQILYGDWTANNTIAALWTYGPVMPLNVALYLVWTGMVGRFGQGLMVEYPPAVYWLAGLAVIIAGLGLVRAARAAWKRRPLDPASVVLWAAQGLTAVSVAAALAYYMLFFIHGVHGRYMFTAFPALFCLLAAGWLAWAPPARRGWLAGGLVLAQAGLSLYALVGLLQPTYAIPPAPTPAELQQMTPVRANLGDTALVLGYQLSNDHPRPGEEVHITVYWQVLSRTDVPYTVFVHLLGPDGAGLNQTDTYPGRGNYATTVWDPGRTFVDVYRLRLPADAPAGEARLALGLFDEASGQRLPVSGADAGAPEQAWVWLGALTVAP